MEKQTSKAASYKNLQIFGYKGPNEKIMEEDIISVMKFDSTGRYLALGDRVGRIIIFQTPENKKKEDQFEYYAEFQSHTREFDPLRSLQVEQEIMGINWLRNQGKYLKLVTTNTRNIKLWKVYEKAEKKVVKSGGKDLNMPKLQHVQSSFVAQVQRAFPTVHLTEINSVSSSLNQEYLLSSDQAQVFLWSLQDPLKPFLAADILQKQKIQDMKEVITCSKMHSSSDSMFAFGTNLGTLKIADLRVSASSDNTALNFKIDTPPQKNFFTDMISGYSSTEFIKQGRYLAARDYLSVKVWDVCNTKKPILNVSIQESIKSKLCELFQNDCLDDKFNLCCSMDGGTLLTGNYNNCFHLIDMIDGSNIQYELAYKKTTISRPIFSTKCPPIQKIDFLRKTLANDFNQRKNMLAVAALNCFYIYSM